MLNLRKLLILAVIISFAIKAYSQEEQPTDASVTTNTTDLSVSTADQELINYNYFTGTANINVDFYKYSSSGVSANLGLIYNTQGIKVDRVASEAGLGWELNTGAYIERQVRGLEDDISVNACGLLITTYPPRRGYWYSSRNDEEPDVFNVVFNNRSIRFIFSKNGTLLTFPKANIKIERYIDNNLVTGEMTNSNQPSGNFKFKIIDEAGNQYHFKVGRGYTKNNTLTIPQAANQPPATCTQTYNAVEKWVIEKIITYEGQEINYTYLYDNVNILYANSQNFWEKNSSYGEAHEEKIENTYDIARLMAIDYPNGVKVEFYYESNRCDLPGSYKLKDIYIKEKYTTAGLQRITKTYTLNQAYFVSPPSTNPATFETDLSTQINCSNYESRRLRLKLNSIDMHGTNNQVQRLYTFSYDPTCLPERVYGARDIFGYGTGETPQVYTNSNGLTYSLTIPEHSFNYGSYTSIGMDKSLTNTYNHTQSCVLKEIENVQGGKIILSYQGNNNVLPGIGGLNLNKVTYKDGFSENNNTIKQFIYGDGEIFVPQGDVTYGLSYQQTSTSSNYIPVTVYSNNSNMLNENLNNSSFGYKTVTVQNKNYLGNIISKETYYYSGSGTNLSINNGADDNKFTPTVSNPPADFYKAFDVPPFTNKQYLRAWGIGLLLKTEKYDHNSKLLETVENKYNVTEQFYYYDEYKGVHKLPKKVQFILDAPVETYDDVYYPYSGRTSLSETIKKKYVSDQSYFQTSTTYSYDNNNNLSLKTTTNSLGETIRDVPMYNYYWNSVSSGGGAAIDKLNQDDVQRNIYTRTSKMIQTPYSQPLLKCSISGLSIVTGNVIRPKYIYESTMSTPIDVDIISHIQDFASGTSVQNFRLMHTVTKYDNKGYDLEHVDVSGQNYTSQIWDNETGKKLAIVKNAKYDDIAYCGFESHYDATNNNKGNIDFPLVGITIEHTMLGRFSYKLSNANNWTLWTTGNLTIGKKYIVSFWLYQGTSADANDGINPINIQSSGVTYNGWTLYRKEFVATANGIGIWGDGFIDEIRVYPSESRMTSFNYLPLWGQTSEVDMNDRFTTREYDDLGRITLERDHNGNIIKKYKTVILGQD